MDSVFSRFLGPDFLEEGNGDGMTWFSPLVNVAETDDEFEISVDLPGIKLEDVNVELRDNDLWITGERKEEHEEKQKNWHRIEHRYGQFRRVIPLAHNVDAEKIDAEYKDGVLKILVPKTESAKPKRIAIKG